MPCFAVEVGASLANKLNKCKALQIAKLVGLDLFPKLKTLSFKNERIRYHVSYLIALASHASVAEVLTNKIHKLTQIFFDLVKYNNPGI